MEAELKYLPVMKIRTMWGHPQHQKGPCPPSPTEHRSAPCSTTLGATKAPRRQGEMYASGPWGGHRLYDRIRTLFSQWLALAKEDYCRFFAEQVIPSVGSQEQRESLRILHYRLGHGRSSRSLCGSS